MNDFQSFRHVKKTRKEHVCVFCNRIVPIGLPIHNFVGMADSDFQSWYVCDFCYNTKGIMDDSSEGISGDELYYFVDEFLVLGDCPNCNNHYNQKKWGTNKEIMKMSCSACGHRWNIFIGFLENKELITREHNEYPF